MNNFLPTLDSGIGTCEKMFSCTSFSQSAEEIIKPIARLMNAPTGIILRFQKNMLGEYPIEEASYELPTDLRVAYRESFYDTDPIAQIAFSQMGDCGSETSKKIVPLFEQVDPSKFIDSFYYNEFLRSHGLGDVLAMFIPIEGNSDEVACVAVQRWNDLDRFNTEDFATFRQLYPLLSTCLNNISLRESANLMTANSKGLVGHSLGLSVWDEHFRLIHASPHALTNLNFAEENSRAKWLEWFCSVAQNAPKGLLGTLFNGTNDGLHINIERSIVGDGIRYTVMSIVPDFKGAIAHWASRCDLTLREQQVCAYITSGLTNESTGHQMGISVKTVQNHLVSIFAKIGVNCRSQLVARLMGWEL